VSHKKTSVWNVWKAYETLERCCFNTADMRLLYLQLFWLHRWQNRQSCCTCIRWKSDNFAGIFFTNSGMSTIKSLLIM